VAGGGVRWGWLAECGIAPEGSAELRMRVYARCRYREEPVGRERRGNVDAKDLVTYVTPPPTRLRGLRSEI